LEAEPGSSRRDFLKIAGGFAAGAVVAGAAVAVTQPVVGPAVTQTVTETATVVERTTKVGTSSHELETAKELTVGLIYDSQELLSRDLAVVQWAPNGDTFTYYQPSPQNGSRYVWGYDLKTRAKAVLIDSNKTPVLEEPQSVGPEKRFAVPNYLWSPTGKEILLPSGNDLYLYDVASATTRRLTDDQETKDDPHFSPDGKRIAFIKNHNIHVLDIETGIDVPLTSDGREHVFVGQFDWAYQEEFASVRTGFFWAPDGQHIAFFQLDETEVPEFPIVDFVPVENEVQSTRYPKAGDDNSIVRVGVVSIDNPRIVWLDVGSETDIYIPRIRWLPDSQSLAIYRLNRAQNRLDLLLGDISSGSTRAVLVEEATDGWIDIYDDLTFLKHGERFVWSSNRDGFKHLYLYEIQGNLIRQLTQGSWEVDSLVAVDEGNGLVYFGAGKENVWDRDLYKVDLNGEGLTRLSEQKGWHSIDMNPSCEYYLDYFSDFTTPTIVGLRSSDGKLLDVIEPNEALNETLKEYRLSRPDFFSFDTDYGVKLNALMIKPPDFDPSKKYPVLVYVYGGPGSQTVFNAWDSDSRRRQLWHEMMAQNGYIIFTVDNRGTGGRGRDWMKAVYRQLGEVEVQDQIAGVEYLRTLPYVDSVRIGIWGWSYGGYMTSMCMLKGADYFKVGIAVAPPTDWKDYDSIYTERYMGKPQDNPQGYTASSAVTHAKDLKGKLLLIHGTSDDNVHMSNSIQLAYAFEKAHIPFDLMLYPRQMHHIDDQDLRMHLFHSITDYVLQNL
jgi:dipeptidyl-peptidase-4